ncbi:hypothetical protein EV06_1485 [Prochlorococcus sp. MIT 0602]|nr:hypothetical protein EV06_1485 [Prochlorococcus sp. MIT 0602]KGG17192.1 hypothetical protein EV07_0627 [Prochlorococcus sp. MIT 0603]
MPKEYKVLKKTVDKLAQHNDLGERPMTFTIVSGGYTKWIAEDLGLCKEENCGFYEMLNPFKKHKGSSSDDIQEAIRQSYLLGGIEAYSFANGTITISKSSFPAYGKRHDFLGCTVAHEIAHFLSDHIFSDSLKLEKASQNIEAKDKELFKMKLNRESEKEADAKATEMIFNSGFPADTCLKEIDFMYKLAGLGDITKPNSSHPGYEERMLSIKDVVVKLMASEGSTKSTEGKWKYSRKNNSLVFVPISS